MIQARMMHKRPRIILEKGFTSTNVQNLAKESSYTFVRTYIKSSRSSSNAPNIKLEISNKGSYHTSYKKAKFDNTQMACSDEAYCERAQGKAARDVEFLVMNNEIRSRFNTQRRKIASYLSQSGALGELSLGSQLSWKDRLGVQNPEKIPKTYEELKDEINGGSELTYFGGEIQQTISCIVNHFLNNFLLEINLRHAFSVENLTNKENFFLFGERLIQNIKTGKDKEEIIKQAREILMEENLEALDLDQFIRKLGPSVFKKTLTVDLLKSDDFFSSDFYRYNFQYHKTSQGLNYDHSDTMKFFKSKTEISFTSVESSNKECYSELSSIFKMFDASDSKSHLYLLLAVSKFLLSAHKKVPSYSIFGFLMDEFAKCGLLNYQSIIYMNIPSAVYLESLLSSTNDGKLGPRSVIHYQDVIAESPDILESLIRYQVPRNDIDMFKNFLLFYSFTDIIEKEEQFKNSEISKLLAKSRFLKSRVVLPMEFKTEIPLLVSTDSIYATIRACISMKEFSAIDLLTNKLILHSVEESGKIQVALNPTDDNFGLGKQYVPIVLQENSISETKSRVFTKELIIILLKACKDSDDAGRLMWLIPFVDEYLTKNLSLSYNHISSIKNHRKSEKTMGAEEKQKFKDSEMCSPIDSELIGSIYDTLSFFRIEGKINSYDVHLNFKETLP